jgi:glycine cleavage system regulatory protein
MTLLGKDQPGIVEAVSRVVADYGGNWEESNMARLSGRFAGFIRISAESTEASALEAELVALSRPDLEFQVERIEKDDAQPATTPIHMELVGHDRPGILREITAVIAEAGVNVARLETVCRSAPMSAETHFHVDADLLCPSDDSVEPLREKLEQLGHDMMVEIDLVEADA